MSYELSNVILQKFIEVGILELEKYKYKTIDYSSINLVTPAE